MKLAQVTTQKLSSFSSGQQRLHRRMAVSYRKPNRYAFKIYNFRESSEVHDWRIKEMVDICHQYFSDFLNKGDEAVVPKIFDDTCVHTDVVWDGLHASVGCQGLLHYLHDLKEAFPDFNVNVLEMATCDTNGLWVSYEGTGTGLGTYHGNKGTHHASNFSGVNLFRFNKDRTKIIEVMVYRTAFAEDKEELKDKVSEGGFRDLRLRRLL